MNKRKILLVVGLFLAIIMVWDTVALFTSQDTVVNKFSNGTIDISIDENGFVDINGWNGDIKAKKVNIKNTGSSNCLVRVSITPRWINDNGSFYAGDVSMIQLNFSNSNLWIDGQDGYYYYLDTLGTEKVTEELLSSVQVKDGIELSHYYKGKTLIIDVKAEAVQAQCYINDDGTKKYLFQDNWINLNDEIIGKLRMVVDKNIN